MSSRFRRIVVAFDGSTQSEMALDTAIDMSREYAAHLTVLTVFQPPTVLVYGPAPVDPPPTEELEQQVRAVLNRATERARARGADVEGEFREGHPAEEILRFVEEELADLVVMGSRGLSSARRLFLGSVSDAVVHHTHAAVLIVRPLAELPGKPRTASKLPP